MAAHHRRPLKVALCSTLFAVSVVVGLTIITFPQSAGGQQFVRDFLEGYDPVVPPGNFTTPVIMHMHIDILQLVQVVESEQNIKLRLWTTLTWNDSRLAFEPSKTGFKQLTLPPSSVWTPYLLVDNSAEQQYTRPWSASELNISSDGRVQQMGYMVLIVNCPMAVRLYPLDRQRCPVMISTTDNMYQVAGQYPTAALASYSINHSEFLIDGYSVQPGTPDFLSGQTSPSEQAFDSSKITVTLVIHIQRRAWQHMLSLFVPCTLIGFLAVCGLYLPTDPSGARMERYRYGLTAVLSLIIFQLGLYERLPVSNDGVPVLSVFYSVLFATICSATLTTSVPIAIHRRALKGLTYPSYLMWVLPKKYRDRRKREAALRRQHDMTNSNTPISNSKAALAAMDSEAGATNGGPNLNTTAGTDNNNWNGKTCGVGGGGGGGGGEHELCQKLCPDRLGQPPERRFLHNKRQRLLCNFQWNDFPIIAALVAELNELTKNPNVNEDVMNCIGPDLIASLLQQDGANSGDYVATPAATAAGTNHMGGLDGYENAVMSGDNVMPGEPLGVLGERPPVIVEEWIALANRADMFIMYSYFGVLCGAITWAWIPWYNSAMMVLPGVRRIAEGV